MHTINTLQETVRDKWMAGCLQRWMDVWLDGWIGLDWIGLDGWTYECKIADEGIVFVNWLGEHLLNY